MTVADAIRHATAALGPEPWARGDAEMLMAHALGVTRSAMLLGHMRDPAPDGFAALLTRRLADEPIAHILGSAEFRGLTFTVTPDVLIPRGDSEVLVSAALAAKPSARRVLDCGTGSGALLLAVLAELPQASGVGIDRSAAALAIARANAASLGLNDRATMRLADWDQPGWDAHLGGPFDLIIANPPYIADDATLDISVRQHEPAGALFAGPDGLDAYHILIPQLPALLFADGVALIEIGASQRADVSAIAADAGFSVSLHRDLAGRDRVLELKIPLGKTDTTA